jgi:hypothetical protein
VKIAAQEQKNGRVLCDDATRIMVKSSLCTGGESVEVDRWMRTFAWRRQVAELLFGIAPPWIENRQAKVFSALRRHDLSSVPKISDDLK